jgi:hypothetical protein
MDANRKLQLRIGELMFRLAEAEAIIEQQQNEIANLKAPQPEPPADQHSSAQGMLESRGG